MTNAAAAIESTQPRRSRLRSVGAVFAGLVVIFASLGGRLHTRGRAS